MSPTIVEQINKMNRDYHYKLVYLTTKGKIKHIITGISRIEQDIRLLKKNGYTVLSLDKDRKKEYV